ncbi:site-specific DNA-methyltransferase [bacterium]|jgi:hypothetical protein|nr:site-specific DNA-methyltransferase [bacterium]|tara:strand:+ start:126 stop:1094 length:969 start_codon:yes stop_codon:yes gene_type:complete
MKTLNTRVDELFDYWRDKGYPHYDINDYDSIKELESITKYDVTKLIDGKDIVQTMHGLGYLWCFHPHWLDVHNILGLWDDDDKLRHLCKRTIEWCDKFEDGRISVNRIRQNSKVYLSSSSVSNFRPTAAKYIYNTYGNKGTVYDMSAGWGGRLFGFLASDCKHYIGVEPSTKSYEGNIKILEESSNRGMLFEDFHDVSLHCECAEDFIPPVPVDLAFTSPPYFDCEKYSNESTQSYLRHPTKDEWIEGFLSKMMSNVHKVLKTDGYMIINIANTTKHKWLEEETIKCANVNGYVLHDTLYLILSSIAGKGIKREPIFIFKKV